MVAEKIKPTAKVSEAQVAEFLRDHPDFFQKHAKLFEEMTPPEVNHGGNVVDLQHHMLGSLQKGIQSLKSKYDGLIVSSRDNMSTLHQVHQAALSLMRAATLEQLLETITLDLPALFNVDTVRLGLESKAAEFYDNKFGDTQASGVAFLEEGLIDKVMGKSKSVLLVSDTAKHFLYGFEQIFADCANITESCALLRMQMPSDQRGVLLAFGVRIKDHFQEGQGTELLLFLSQIVEHKLDECLNDSGLSHLI